MAIFHLQMFYVSMGHNNILSRGDKNDSAGGERTQVYSFDGT